MIAETLSSSPWFWVITLGALIALIHRRSKVLHAIQKKFKLPSVSSTTTQMENTRTNPPLQEHDLPDRPA